MSRSVRDPDYQQPKAKEPTMCGAPMLHDAAAENRRIRDNRYPGCTCPPWRYNPAHPKPTAPDCPKHGEQEAA